MIRYTEFPHTHDRLRIFETHNTNPRIRIKDIQKLDSDSPFPPHLQ